MHTRKWKLASIFLWGGVGLVVLGAGLALPRIIPFVETFLYTPRIPVAPPLAETLPTAGVPVESANPVDVAPATIESATEIAEIASTSSPTVTLPETATLEPAVTVDLESTSAEPITETAEMTRTPFPTVTPSVIDSSEPTGSPEVTPPASPNTALTGTAPTNIMIPSIDLDAPVVSIGWKIEKVAGQDQAVWDVPDYRAAGWHDTSALLGVVGNTVLNGHNTTKGEVFRYLYRVEIGAQVFVEGADGEVYTYRVGEKYILREAGQPLSVRLENARYIQVTPDERLTLVTCHPYGSLANRLVLIAYPDANDRMGNGAN